MDNVDLTYLMFLKYNILNIDYKQMLSSILEENNGKNTLDNILFLLERDPNFVYFDEKIFDYLYNLNNDIRHECRSEQNSLKSAEIIRKLNRLSSENFKEKRVEFFRDEWYLRMGGREYFDNLLCNESSDNFKNFFVGDFQFMSNVSTRIPFFFSDNLFVTLSSISYISTRYNDLLDDEEIELMLILLSEIEVSIKHIYKQKDMTDYEYERFKRVIKNVNKNFEDYRKRHKGSENKFKRLVFTLEK